MDYFAHDQVIFPVQGDLLISEPYLPDPNFERTVIYLCEHDFNGSFGFVLNKQGDKNLGELVEGIGLDLDVYVGGPVQRDTLHFLHKDTVSVAKTKPIANGICWGADFESILDSLENKVVSKYDMRFFIGYSGWAAGQLEDEIRAKSWIVCKNVDKELVFGTQPEDLWRTVLESMGGKFKLISNYPLDPRLN